MTIEELRDFLETVAERELETGYGSDLPLVFADQTGTHPIQGVMIADFQGQPCIMLSPVPLNLFGGM